MRAQSQNPLHRAVAHHQKAERGESAVASETLPGMPSTVGYSVCLMSRAPPPHVPDGRCFVNLSSPLFPEFRSLFNCMLNRRDTVPDVFVLQIIKKLIERKQSQIRKVYPGLTCFKEGVRQIPVESIPGISECSCVSACTWMKTVFSMTLLTPVQQECKYILRLWVKTWANIILHCKNNF